MAIEIAVESPLQDDVRRLIAALNAALLELSPPEHCYHMTVEEMADAATTVWIARRDGEAVGCGALRRIAGVDGPRAGDGEVKRMYVRPDLQGQGIAGRIIAKIEAMARAEGLSRLVLETGDRHPAAWRVYERAGFSRRGPFGDYPDSGFSVFYEKPLAAN